jgi:formiminotetrahydrofolate cyclodeaminase
MGYLDGPLHTYVDELAAGRPTPGGGSAAALVGALGAALNCMVANFTVGREKFAAVEEEVRELLTRGEELRAELQRLTQADTEAYRVVSAAYKMPRETDGEKAARDQAIQEALKHAAQVPLATARACHEVLRIAAALVERGNPNLISDVGVAAKFALSGLECAVLNVEINLASIRDEEFVQGHIEELRPMVRESEARGREVWDEVIRHIRKGK